MYYFQCFDECFVFQVVFKTYFYFSFQDEDETFPSQSYSIEQEKVNTMFL